MSSMDEGSRSPTGPAVPFREALRTWMRVGLLSFGGPAGQIGVMHRILVEEKRWVSESQFLHALNYCMLLPGPEAQQLATYIGWFSLHVLFAEVDDVRAAGLRLLVPDLATLDPAALLITIGSFGALFLLRWGMIRTLLLAAAAGLAYGWLG
jgi:chromate transporter